LVSGLAVKGERSESAGHEVPLTARAETTPSPVGEAETSTTKERKMIMERMLFTVRETAEMLGVSRNRVYELINSEQLASIKLGRSRRISIGSIRRFVDTGMPAL
jgi:excisionase family DNA binding protein